MAVYLLAAGGDLNASFPWSITGGCTSSESEAQVALAWSTAVAAIFTNTTFKAFIPAETSLTYTSASTASANLKQTTKTTTTQTAVGTSTSPAIAYGSCSIVSLDTAFATRWGRGRWYWPGLATNALATNGYSYSTAAMTAFSNALTGALTTFNAAAQLCILHRHAITGGPAQFSTTPVTGGSVSDAIAQQRRRADKRQPNRTAWAL